MGIEWIIEKMAFITAPALEIAHICVVTYIWLIMHMHGCALSCQCRKWWGTRITKSHGDVIKWIFFPRYWQIVRGIHRSPVNSPHKGQWRGALIFSLICVWINGWVNNREAGDLRRYRAYYDVIVMIWFQKVMISQPQNCRKHMYNIWGIIYIQILLCHEVKRYPRTVL